MIEFGVTKHALDVVYSQTICWLAIFYSPLIVVVTVIKSFIIFYVRLFYVLFVSRENIEKLLKISKLIDALHIM